MEYQHNIKMDVDPDKMSDQMVKIETDPDKMSDDDRNGEQGEVEEEWEYGPDEWDEEEELDTDYMEIEDVEGEEVKEVGAELLGQPNRMLVWLFR